MEPKTDCCILCSFGGVYCLKTITPKEILKGITEDMNMLRGFIKDNAKCPNEVHTNCCKSIEYSDVINGVMKIFSNDFVKMFGFLKRVTEYSSSFYSMIKDTKQLKDK